MARRTAGPWLAVILATLLLGSGTASASQLSLVGPTRAVATSVARCGSATVAVTPDGTASAGGTYTRVRVSGVPSGCTLGTVRVAGRTGTTWAQVVVAQPAAAVASGAFTVTVPAFVPPTTTAGSVWVTLDGWPAPASWTFTPQVTTGCVVRTASGTVTGKACSVTNFRVDNSWGVAPNREANSSFTVVAPTVDYGAGEIVRVTLDFSTAVGMPSGWRWTTTGVGPGNLVAVPGTSCSTLPVIVADVAAWNTNVFVPIKENRAGGSGFVCS